MYGLKIHDYNEKRFIINNFYNVAQKPNQLPFALIYRNEKY
ncbi:hypothetical protein bthur0001_55090 [Bacillus thuringiensis serovar tochigiensis BGSC 4Y1]|nr:hypothetical protein bthur0001_55090 [Bacillus thuringiensis serovar tochigiensis BGSC 4Y1]